VAEMSKIKVNEQRAVDEFQELTAIDAPSFGERQMADRLIVKLKELGFEGVLFTEALNVPVITSQYSAEEAELKAVIAGAARRQFPIVLRIRNRKRCGGRAARHGCSGCP